MKEHEEEGERRIEDATTVAYHHLSVPILGGG